MTMAEKTYAFDETDLIIIQDALITYALGIEAKIDNMSNKTGVNTKYIAINRQLAKDARRISEMFNS